MGREAQNPPEPKIPRGTGEKAEEAARVRRRRVAASFGMAGTYDRVCRRLGRTRSVEAAADDHVPLSERLVPLGGGSAEHWWKLLFPLVSFGAGASLLLIGLFTGGPLQIGFGLVLAGLGPAGLMTYLSHEPPKREPFPRAAIHDADSPFPMPRMTGVEGFYPPDQAPPSPYEAQRARALDGRPLPDPFEALGHPGAPAGSLRRTVSQPGAMTSGDDVGLAQRLDDLGEHELASIVRSRRDRKRHLR